MGGSDLANLAFLDNSEFALNEAQKIDDEIMK